MTNRTVMDVIQEAEVLAYEQQDRIIGLTNIIKDFEVQVDSLTQVNKDLYTKYCRMREALEKIANGEYRQGTYQADLPFSDDIAKKALEQSDEN